jgi:hypothetical protein
MTTKKRDGKVPDRERRLPRRGLRILGLAHYVGKQWPLLLRTGNPARDAAAQRARNAISALGSALETLYDEQARERDVAAAIRAANDAYRATHLRGETFAKHVTVFPSPRLTLLGREIPERVG